MNLKGLLSDGPSESLIKPEYLISVPSLYWAKNPISTISPALFPFANWIIESVTVSWVSLTVVVLPCITRSPVTVVVPVKVGLSFGARVFIFVDNSTLAACAISFSTDIFDAFVDISSVKPDSLKSALWFSTDIFDAFVDIKSAVSLLSLLAFVDIPVDNTSSLATALVLSTDIFDAFVDISSVKPDSTPRALWFSTVIFDAFVDINSAVSSLILLAFVDIIIDNSTLAACAISFSTDIFDVFVDISSVKPDSTPSALLFSTDTLVEISSVKPEIALSFSTDIFDAFVSIFRLRAVSWPIALDFSLSISLLFIDICSFIDVATELIVLEFCVILYFITDCSPVLSSISSSIFTALIEIKFERASSLLVALVSSLIIFEIFIETLELKDSSFSFALVSSIIIFNAFVDIPVDKADSILIMLRSPSAIVADIFETSFVKFIRAFDP